jgi:hypothetical protein
MYSGLPDNFWYVLSSRIHGTIVEWFYKRREVTAAWEAQDLIFSHKVTELIKHYGDKGRTYNIIPLDWSINYYDIYNRNGLIETIIFYTYIIFYLTSKFKH